LAGSHRPHPHGRHGTELHPDFELERVRREIEATQDPQQLRALSKELLLAWFSEKASTKQAIREQLADG